MKRFVKIAIVAAVVVVVGLVGAAVFFLQKPKTPNSRITNSTALFSISLDEMPLDAMTSISKKFISNTTVSDETMESCKKMHDGYVYQFIASKGFGLMREVFQVEEEQKTVLGFGSITKQRLITVDPDSMMQQEALSHPPPTEVMLEGDVYTVAEHQLMGILKQQEPVVYVLAIHKDKIKTGQRKLTEFEERSLASLREGEDMVLERNESDFLLVGSIRARTSCLECHGDKKAGDLLGAYTYRMRLKEQRASP